jgi:hypothetical protein
MPAVELGRGSAGTPPAGLLAAPKPPLLARSLGGGPGAGCCPDCHRPFGPFGTCRRRDCPRYLPLWCGDTVAWVQENAKALAEDGRIDLVTLTAPGVDYLPWDRDRCLHEPGVACSGKLGCTVIAPVLEYWNRTAPARLTSLLNAAHERVRRRYGWRRPGWLGIWETQRRGALHAHMLFASKDRAYVVALVAALRDLTPLHVFGGVDLTKCTVKAGERHSRGAAYLYKTVRYVTKAAADGPERRELVAMLSGPLAGRPFMRASPKLTTSTYATMRNLRYRRYLFVRGRVTDRLPCQAIDLIRRLDAERRERDRLALDAVADLRRAFCRPPPSPWAVRPALALDQRRLL